MVSSLRLAARRLRINAVELSSKSSETKPGIFTLSFDSVIKPRRPRGLIPFVKSLKSLKLITAYALVNYRNWHGADFVKIISRSYAILSDSIYAKKPANTAIVHCELKRHFLSLARLPIPPHWR